MAWLYSRWYQSGHTVWLCSLWHHSGYAGGERGLFQVNTLTSRCCSLLPDSYTFQQVQEHTDQIWKFQRHDLIEEYHSRPAAPPPFILLSHLQLFIKRVILKTPAKRHKQLSTSVSVPLLNLLAAWVQRGWRWRGSSAQNPGRSAGLQATQAAPLLLALSKWWGPSPEAPPGQVCRGLFLPLRTNHRVGQGFRAHRPEDSRSPGLSSHPDREQTGEERGGGPAILGDLPEGELPAESAVPAKAAARAEDRGHQQ